MSKIVPPKDIGIPVPSPAPPSTDHLIVYYGPSPLTPSYAPTAPNGRIDAGPVSALAIKNDSAGVPCYDDPISSELPAGLSGSYDFVFTLMDANGNEGDFSPAITVTIDTTVPPTLGQPVQLG
jgi:hypothetical protein